MRVESGARAIEEVSLKAVVSVGSGLGGRCRSS